MKIPVTTLLTCLLLIVSGAAAAQSKPVKTFGETLVYYSAFNSSFIDPDIASRYDITRGKDQGLVNIAVVEKGSPHGEAAQISGTVSNLIQQQQTLDFVEIREGDAVYYLAPFEFDNEDPLTFNIQVQKQGQASPYTLTFQRTFYHDQE